MRKSFALLFILSGCSTGTVTDADNVKKIVTDYYDGIRLKETARMSGVTTSDFILYEAGKVWNNDSVFREMSKYPFTVDYSFKDFKVVVDGQKAYASYGVVADFVFEDTISQRFDFVESAAFEKVKGNWKMKLLQVCERLPRYDTIAYAPDYLAERVAQFESEPFEKGGIVLLGNSIVEYGNWKRLFGDSSVVNRGVAADNTFGVLTRLEDVIERRPSKVFLEIGINDVAQNIPLDMIVDNIEKIVDKIHAGSAETRIFVVSLLPSNDDVKENYPDAFERNRISDVINERLRLLARDEIFDFVDLNSKLRDVNGDLERKFASEDGLHLNEEGYEVFVGLLRRVE